MKRGFALLILISIIVFTSPVETITTCGLTSPAFCEEFTSPTSPQGRGGDLNHNTWSAVRFNPDGTLSVRPNHVRKATIPTCRAGVSAGDVYPPDDLLICDGTSSWPDTLQMAVVIQEYGNMSPMIRQPFDFNGRTGKIVFDVDAWGEGNLGTYINLAITQDPVPATSFAIAQNEEPGPRAKEAIHIIWTNSGDTTRCTVGSVLVYNNYTMTTVSPSFEVTGSSRPSTNPGDLNHIEIEISASHLTIYESDYSTDGGATFPNFRKIYEADIDLDFTQGYVHVGARNHSTNKFMFPLTSVYHWDNIGFDGPTIAVPRAYEIPDNNTTGTYIATPPDMDFDYERLGYAISDGTSRTQGIWNEANTPVMIGPFSIPSVNISGITAVTLTFNIFFNTITHTPTTSWGILYRFNSGSWRTRTLTSAEVSVLINDLGSAGNLSFALDVPVGDLSSGTNTLNFDTVNVPMDLAPAIMNIDLLVSTSDVPVDSESLRLRIKQ